MKNQKKTGHALHSLLPMGLQSLFAVSALILCVISIFLYKAIQEKNEAYFEASTATGYLSVKMQQTATLQNVEIRTENGIEVLAIREDFSGEIYETRIFCAGGYLKEDFVHENTPFVFENGSELISLQAVTFELTDKGVLSVYIIITSGDEIALSYYLPKGEPI